MRKIKYNSKECKIDPSNELQQTYRIWSALFKLPIYLKFQAI